MSGTGEWSQTPPLLRSYFGRERLYFDIKFLFFLIGRTQVHIYKPDIAWLLDSVRRAWRASRASRASRAFGNPRQPSYVSMMYGDSTGSTKAPHRSAFLAVAGSDIRGRFSLADSLIACLTHCLLAPLLWQPCCAWKPRCSQPCRWVSSLVDIPLSCTLYASCGP